MSPQLPDILRALQNQNPEWTLNMREHSFFLLTDTDIRQLRWRPIAKDREPQPPIKGFDLFINGKWHSAPPANAILTSQDA